jgi:hypothetical protein
MDFAAMDPVELTERVLALDHGKVAAGGVKP